MLRKTFSFRQFQNQFWRDSIAYSSGFSSTTSDWNIASSAYSPVYNVAPRRKWPRDKKYKDKVHIITDMARRSIGLEELK